MILQVEKFQDSCKKILGAIDTDSALKNVVFSDKVELEAHGKELHLNATNGEYFVSVSLPLDEEATLRAVVDAKLFLTLVSKLTTKTMEVTTTDVALVVKANGTYRFPLQYDVDSMIVLPKILINNPTSNFMVSGATLMSILNNNTREVNPDATNKSQRYYYLDQEGCLTYTNSSACVNSFIVSSPIKVLLNLKLVKLFKLFGSGDVGVTLGQEDIGGIAQTRIKFQQGGVEITSILENQEPITIVPVGAIRTRATKTFDYSVSFDKKEFLDAIDRLMLFDTANTLNRGIGIFEFNETSVTIHDCLKNNNEVIAYVSGTCETQYVANLGLESLKEILTNSDSQIFNLGFGDSKAFVISCGNIKNVVSQRAIR